MTITPAPVLRGGGGRGDRPGDAVAVGQVGAHPGTGLLLAAVVVAFGCVCLLVSHVARYYAYDEAIYLSQVYPGLALPFTAPRARGLTWLIAPLGWVDAPVPVVRGYLLMLNAGLMYLGFRSWLPVLGRRAVLAAGVFALYWPTLFEATEVFPNLPAAMCALAAAGYLAQSATPAARLTRTPLDRVPPVRTPLDRVPLIRAPLDRVPLIRAPLVRMPLVKAGLAVGLVAAIRPMEAVFVTAGLGLAALLLPSSAEMPARAHARSGGWPRVRDVRRRWTALLAGLLLGWVPWLVEAQTRFGGPVQRMREATANVSGGLHPGNLVDHLMLTDGPISGGTAQPVPLPGVLWWAVLAAGLMVTTGIAVARLVARLSRPAGPALDSTALDSTAGRGAGSGGEPGAVFGAVAGLAGAASAAQYLLLAGVIEARFLLPAYALLTVALCSLLPAGRSNRRVGRAGPWSAGPWSAGRVLSGVAVLAASAVLAAFASWQLHTVVQVSEPQQQVREVPRRLAAALTARTGGQPCYFASQSAFPVISFASGCEGTRLTPKAPKVFLRQDPGTSPVYGLSGYDPRTGPLVPEPGSARPLRSEGAGNWWIFVIPRSSVEVLN